MSNKNQTKTNQPQLTGILGIIERTGNKIPHPIYMFIAFFFIVLGLSAVLAAAGFQTVNPVNNEEVSVVNLLTAAGLADILKGFPTEWAGFSNPWTRRGKWERFFKWHASPRQQF